MNTTVIVLGVIIILLIYVLYYFLSNQSSKLSDSANLKQPQPPITNVQKATNSRYGYTLWLYVNIAPSRMFHLLPSRNKLPVISNSNVSCPKKCHFDPKLPKLPYSASCPLWGPAMMRVT